MASWYSPILVSTVPLIVLPILLEGPVAFSPTDDPRYAAPEFDDSAWPRVSVPGSWANQGFRPKENVAWYRFRFTTPPELGAASLGVYLGSMTGADQAFLNGQKIGSEGLIARRPVEALFVPRLYPIPSTLLRSDGENVLAVRVWSEYSGRGLANDTPQIDRVQTLEQIRARALAAEVTRAEFAMLACLCVGIGGLGITLLQRRNERRRHFLLLLVGTLAALTVTGIDLPHFYFSGFKTPTLQLVHHAAFGIAGVWLVGWIAAMVDARPKTLWALVLLGTALSVASALLRYPARTLRWMVLIMLVYWAIYVLYVAGLAVLFRRSGDRYSYAWMVAALLLGAVYASDLLGYVSGLPVVEVVTTGLMFSTAGLALYLMYAHHRDTREELRSVSVSLLTAQEVERQSLGRELHDGVAQDLQAVKLALQMNAIDKGALVDQISGAIDQLRETAQELRLDRIGSAPLSTELVRQAEMLADRARLHLLVERSGPIEKLDSTPKETQLHLFRIVQEALSNAARHAQAREIHLQLKCGAELSISVKDDGAGFDVDAAYSGLGLKTMAERAVLIGGSFSIESGAQGTIVRVSLPIP